MSIIPPTRYISWGSSQVWPSCSRILGSYDHSLKISADFYMPTPPQVRRPNIPNSTFKSDDPLLERESTVCSYSWNSDQSVYQQATLFHLGVHSWNRHPHISPIPAWWTTSWSTTWRWQIISPANSLNLSVQLVTGNHTRVPMIAFRVLATSRPYQQLPDTRRFYLGKQMQKLGLSETLLSNQNEGSFVVSQNTFSLQHRMKIRLCIRLD